MQPLTPALMKLHDAILAAGQEEREALRPQLCEMIAEMQKNGEPVPPQIRCLQDELTNDAIEAQFDNMPL